MKIMQVIPCLRIGGAEKMCESLSIALKNQGNEVVVVCLFDLKSKIDENLRENGIDVVYLHKHVGIDFSISRRIKEIIKDYNPDIIHTHLNVLKYVYTPAKRAGRIPIVHTVHSLAQKECPYYDRVINKRLFNKKNALPVALSETIRDTIKDVYGLNSSDIPVVYNGITPCVDEGKNTYSTSGIIKIISVANFSPVKNHIGLIEAFYKFQKTYQDSILTLVGAGSELENVKKKVEELQLNERVFFLGSQPDVFSFLKQSDVFVLVSKYEGMPMSIIEAMSCGLPIVASEVGGIPNMIQNDKNGILVTPNSDKICEALLKLSNNENLRSRIGRAAFKTYQTEYTSAIMAKNYIKVYKEITVKE